MKSGVLITLILCGTLMLAGPALMDHFRDHDQLALSNPARLAFWFGGLLAISGAIVGFFVENRRDTHQK